MRKVNLDKVVKYALVVGGIGVNLYITKKINDVQKEIEYFERQQKVYYSRKENERIWKNRMKERQEEEA